MDSLLCLMVMLEIKQLNFASQISANGLFRGLMLWNEVILAKQSKKVIIFFIFSMIEFNDV